MTEEAAFREGGASLVWVEVERLFELLVELVDTDKVDIGLVWVETELTDVELASVVSDVVFDCFVEAVVGLVWVEVELLCLTEVELASNV